MLDEDVERLHHARADSGRRELSATGDRVAAARERLQLRLVRVELGPQRGEHGDDRDPGQRDRQRAPVDEPRPAAPRAVLGVAPVDEPLRQHTDAVDPRAEHREHRR